MTKKLLVVAASGLLLAIVLLSTAWAIGGRGVLAASRHGGWHFTFDDDHGPQGAYVTRPLPFDPGAPLAVDAPVALHFTRGDHTAMTVSGPAAVVAAMRWQNNRLSLPDMPLPDMPLFAHHHRLDVEITAPRLPPLTFAGAGDVSLEKLDQDDLKLDLSGAGNIAATGQVRSVTAHISGAGNVDLADLNAQDAAIDASGLGNIDLNARGKVELAISGAGNVTLHRKPAQLTSQVSGIGSLDQDY